MRQDTRGHDGPIGVFDPTKVRYQDPSVRSPRMASDSNGEVRIYVSGVAVTMAIHHRECLERVGIGIGILRVIDSSLVRWVVDAHALCHARVTLSVWFSL